MKVFDTVRAWMWDKAIAWLNHEKSMSEDLFGDLDKLSQLIRPCDVLLVEGKTRLSKIIKTVTQSVWTHAAFYIGRLHDIDTIGLRKKVKHFYDGPPSEQLVVDALLGRGTVITPLAHYRGYRLRICRPTFISPEAASQVISSVVNKLGSDYDARLLFDLARFMAPYRLLPRTWRSTLFHHKPNQATRITCSTMLVEAFQDAKYSIWPTQGPTQGATVSYDRFNPRLFTPQHFDLSPYFDIVKVKPYSPSQNDPDTLRNKERST